MSVTMGDAIVYLTGDPSHLRGDLKQADSMVKKFASGAQKAVGAIFKVGVLAVAAAGAAAAATLVTAVKKAADAGEDMAKFEATFGAASKGLIANLDELAAATGRSRYELRSASANFGAVTKALGFSENAAADMSAAALEMAVDLGAFHNLPTEDVANRIQKALTGETESMKALGVVISAARIQEELRNMGMEDNLQLVDEAVKAQAIFNIIQRQTTDAVGVAAAESGSFTGQVVALKAAWSDFLIDVGTKVLPILTPLLTKFGAFAREVLPLVVDWVANKMVPALVAFGNYVQTNILPAVQAMGEWISTKLVPALQVFGEFIRTNVLPALQIFGAWLAETLIPALTEIWSWFAVHIMPVISALAEVVGAVLGKALEMLVAIWRNVLKPALKDMWEKIDKLYHPIEKVQEAVAKLVDWLKKLADKIKNIKLPDWMTPGSPTPWELGLRGVAKALEKELTPQLGRFSTQLQAAGMGGVAGGGNVTNQNDQRSFFQGANIHLPNENMLDLLAKEVRRI